VVASPAAVSTTPIKPQVLEVAKTPEVPQAAAADVGMVNTPPTRPSATTPQTVKAADATFSMDDSADDVMISADLLSGTKRLDQIPEYIQPAVTSKSPVLPDNAWLTPPSQRKMTEEKKAQSLKKSIDFSDAKTSPLPSSINFDDAVETTTPLPSTMDFESSATNITAKTEEVKDTATEEIVPVAAAADVVVAAAASPAPAAAAAVDASPLPAGGMLDSVFSPPQDSIFSPENDGAEKFADFASSSVLNASGGNPDFTPQKDDVEEKSVSVSPSAPEVVKTFDFEGTKEEPASGVPEANANNITMMPEPVQAPEEEEVPVEEIQASSTFAGWGEGLLSPIREETGEYADSTRENNTQEIQKTQTPVAAPAVAAAATPAQSPQIAPTMELNSFVPVTPLAFSPLEKPASSAAPETTPVAAAVPAVAPTATPVAEPAAPATPVAAAAVSEKKAPSSPAPEGSPGMQAELDRIKQKIRVWDVTSPAKNNEVNVQTPEKLPKYTESDLMEAKLAAQKTAQEETDKMRAEFLELKEKYEKEKSVSAQFKEIVDEYESTLRVLVEGHGAEMQKEKKVSQQLQNQNVELLAFVEQNQKLVDELNADKENANVELNKVAAAQKQAEESVATLNQELETVTNKYQGLKQQAAQKLNLANERIQQQQTVNAEQISHMKTKLSQAVSKIEKLSDELATKKKENLELVSICDTLVKQLEGTK
jgi:hypothetical protein